MDQTHIHLWITHLPIVGSILGAVVLGHGLWTRTDQTKVAAYFLFIISAIGAGIAYVTGEAAEETVEDISGVSKNMIEQHEELAAFALVSLIALGIVSVIGLLITTKKSSYTRVAAVVVFIISLISFGLAAGTGYFGGQIRHTEITSKIDSSAQDAEKESD